MISVSSVIGYAGVAIKVAEAVLDTPARAECSQAIKSKSFIHAVPGSWLLSPSLSFSSFFFLLSKLKLILSTHKTALR